MTPELERKLLAALERPHRLGTIGGVLEDQLAHSASFSSVLADLFPDTPPRSGMDLGTGGGLPGVVLAAMWPSTAWTLVDMRSARAAEVERVVLALGLDTTTDVLATEAQYVGRDPQYREQFDVVVARSFGPPSLTAECAAGVVRLNGWFVVSEPPEAKADGERWDTAGLAALGFSQPVRRAVDDARFVAFQKTSHTPDRVPRIPPRANRGWLAP